MYPHLSVKSHIVPLLLINGNSMCMYVTITSNNSYISNHDNTYVYV